MSWSGQGGFERRGYHHGNLREALVEAALALIGEKGPAGFTIAEAARLAGVSPGAPYRHFRDAEALLAEVALRGFDRFAALLSAAWNNGRPDPISAFEALGRAYLAFAREEPAFYAAMFETRIAFDNHPGLLTAGDRAFAVLREGAERLTSRLPPGQRPPSLMVALHVWDCLAVRAGRSLAAQAADVPRRSAGGRCADLFAEPRVGRWRPVAVLTDLT
jgi:AcrR family transcriptional regulator